jgi:hypothetical protein
MAASPSATATAVLVPGPPSSSWTDSTATGPMTVDDFYGSPGSSATGFIDGYLKAWDEGDVGLDDQLAHYTSVFWAQFALNSFKSGAQRDVTHTSFKLLTGLGPSAFEVTYPADTDGYKWDEIWFAQGDYLAAISMASKGYIAHDVLLDQTVRQLHLLPNATGELRSIGTGVLVGVGVVGTILVVIAIVATIAIVMLVRRRPSTLAGIYPATSGTPAALAGAQMSEDRRHWWDGQAWQDTALRIPPWASISADGTQWWDGASWRTMPSAGRY